MSHGLVVEEEQQQSDIARRSSGLLAPLAQQEAAAEARRVGRAEPSGLARRGAHARSQTCADVLCAGSAHPDTVASNSSHVLGQLVAMHAQFTAQQARVNAASARLHGINFMFNYANGMRSLRVEQELGSISGRLCEGENKVEQLCEQVHSNRSGVASLKQHLAALAERVDAQQRELDAQRQLMEDAICRLDAHTEKMDEQDRALQALLSRRLRVDGGIDLGILAAAAWLADSGIVDLGTRILVRTTWLAVRPLGASFGMPRATRRRFGNAVRAMVKLAVFYQLFKKLRTAAVELGVHSLVGQPAVYWDWVVDWLTGTVAQLTTENVRV